MKLSHHLTLILFRSSFSSRYIPTSSCISRFLAKFELNLNHHRVYLSTSYCTSETTMMDPKSKTKTLVTSTGPATELFANSVLSQNYAQFRPSYNSNAYKMIHDFCKETCNNLELAVDVGCGSGQSSAALADFFPKVIGLDVSETQIAQAPTDIPGLSFQCAQAEDLSSIENETVDLVTVAQAFHWFDKEKFFQEADRVLKPGGSLVIYGYGNVDIENTAAHDYIRDEIYTGILNGYWNAGRHLIEDKYASVTLPYDGWRRDDSLVMAKVWTVSELIGYLSSWSALNKYLAANPKSTLVKDLRSELMRCYGISDLSQESSIEVKLSWPIFILMGHKPSLTK